jgi:hypothetical protein
MVTGSDSKEKTPVGGGAQTREHRLWWAAGRAVKLAAVKNCRFCFCLLLLVLTSQTVSAVELKDQFGASHSLEEHAGQVQLAIVVSAKKLRRLKPWEQQLRQQYPDLPLLRIADVPQTAPTDYALVAEKLRKRLPEDVWVLIDLDSVWARRYELDTAVPNLLLFDAQGKLLQIHRGLYKPDLFSALQVDLDAALVDQLP